MLVATTVVACGVEGYQAWWDGNNGATVAPPPAADAGAEAAAVVDAGHDASKGDGEAGVARPPIKNVFFILMARQSWSDIAGSPSAPYINGTLLPMAAHSEACFAAPAQIGSSEPNVVWLEAGDNLGIVNNASPVKNHQASTAHLVDQLEAAGISWKAYVDRATAGLCPIVDAYPLATMHVPFLFFDDVVGSVPAADAKRCVQHVVPLTQLATDLQKGTAPRYSFIVPDMCDDMHDDCNTGDPIRQGDDWLSTNVPPILGSSAYADHGAVFIAWDFSSAGYVPIGFIALSEKVRPGFAGHTTLTTSSTLRSMQEIFGVAPLLGDAASAPDVAELFQSFP